MMIGQSLSRLQQSANTGTTINEFIQAIENSLESVVNGFLDFIVGKTVAKEIRDKVLPYIPSTVLTRTQLENIERDVKTANCMLDHPMCKLFSLGLLGCVHRVSQTGHLIQEFAFHMAGNADLAIREISIPATSDVFLVHPALAHPLARGAPTLTLRRGGAAARDSTRMKSALLVISSNGIRAHRENAVSSCG